MSNALTIPAQNIAPVRCGYLGVGVPRIPSGIAPYDYDAALAEIVRRTGDDVELVSRESGFIVWDNTVGDALSEGESARDALESALEQV